MHYVFDLMPRLFVLAALAVVALILVAIGGTAFALSLEEHNDFCASCHTQPEVEYVSRAQKSPPVDLASTHVITSVKCIDCHSGPPPFGRKDGLIQGAQDLLAYLKGNYPQPAITTHPLPDANCVKCHADIFQSRAIQNHYHFYLPDWQRALGDKAAKCVDCHSSHTTANGHLVKFAPDQKINPICAACHEFQGIK